MLSFVAGLFASCNTASTGEEFKSPQETFTPKETSNLKNALLIDVRDYEEVEEISYDVKNVINIPLDSIESKLESIPKDKQVVFVCKSGKRSKNAYDILVEKGYSNVASMEGGIIAWEEAGLPVLMGEDNPKKSCCADPSSPNCNPDGTCKTTDGDSTQVTKDENKSCCSKDDKSK